jgi:hypothetical protein
MNRASKGPVIINTLLGALAGAAYGVSITLAA